MGDHSTRTTGKGSLPEGLSFWNQESLPDKADAGRPRESGQNKFTEIIGWERVSLLLNFSLCICCRSFM